MKKLFISLIIVASSFVSWGQDVIIKEKTTIDFSLSIDETHDKSIFVYGALYTENGKPITPTTAKFSDDKPCFDTFVTSDFAIGEYKMLSRSVYFIDKPITFFSDSLLLCIPFLKRTFPSYTITEVKPKSYKAEGTTMAPSFIFSEEIIHPLEVENEYQQKILDNYGELEIGGVVYYPNKMSYRSCKEFSRVMMRKTNAYSVVVKFYYQLNSTNSIVQEYAISGMYNLPPSFVGGGKLLLEKVKENVLEVSKDINEL
ncbi:hypothetical protein [Flammeovirga kamogawensis]|uniref:DUF4369 domain-containing protein n=1 Tax=Flammeovirga kamogawensis TaxID=373891 RepID=A0ABX8GZH5_9BACT|nr:hypothetical protein [Flammeovirga kamogawensis]MBB6459399.1 hypothetical protein [Flammeovirga kamogawensis]QWG08955.1 hypothetical protein KM029_08420 [Flammeovirga kamogawensis]TRX67245.1 hypothetical protein EO216_03465 [Flammeovirga kamogawensis]